MPAMTLPHLTDEQIRTWTLEEKDRWWLKHVYKGDMPQLTLRSGITGFLLGGVLSATNLYVGAKTGWTLGVGITSVILAFGLWKFLQRAGVVRREFTILENNAMQSIATSAGYMTGPLISSLAAYMMITNKLLPWHQIVLWNVAVSVLGVLFAFPMKRRFINDEQHPFPEGRAAGVVMDSLHSSDAAVGILKARILLWASAIAAFWKLLQAEAILRWFQMHLFGLLASVTGGGFGAWAAGHAEKLAADGVPWHMPEKLSVWFDWLHLPVPRIFGTDAKQLTVDPSLDLALVGAGGLMGIRGGVSLLIGAILNYCILAPIMIERGEIKPAPPRRAAVAAATSGENTISPTDGSREQGTASSAPSPAAPPPAAKPTYGLRQITLWSLWPGVACMVVASFVAFFAKPQILLAAVTGLWKKRERSDVLAHIEFPMWISVVGIPVVSLWAAVLAHSFFGVKIWACLVGLPLAFVLCLVAANSTALTSITPVSATAKITQLFYGMVQQGNIHTNLATAGLTAEVVSNSSNLLMDIKPGYMLGANPRQQAVAHVIGIVSGGLASTWLFFVLFTRNGVEGIQSEQFPMPSVTVWKAVAEVLSTGFHQLPSTTKYAAVVGALVGLTLETARIVTRGRFPLSPVGLGLAFVIDFGSSFSMFLGAFFFWLMGVGRLNEEQAKSNLWVENHEPICAGIIAGSAIIGILDALVQAFLLSG